MKRISLLLALLAAPLPSWGRAQTPAPPAEEAWNGARALELIGRAQTRRTEANADTGLINYRASARIYVYFYLDREDTGERNLVKTDQLALEVLWGTPDRVKQRIVGWRDQKSLPTNINYHLDHLTVVQENFGDEIRLGDGDEVRGVPHPAAPGAAAFYEYRLADSLTLRLPGTPDPVRVYELQVRPRDASQPAIVGSLFVEQRAGDIVRMDFTFTAAAYVDKYLDYINISLDNGLWRGRTWLPNEQRVEIRRRIPQLDIPAGSVIRANMRVGEYEFNQPLPSLAFLGPPVVTVPRAQREAFPFEQELFEEVRLEGLGPQVELGEIRRMAAELAREQALRRVEGVRLRVPAASELLRYNRAEGLTLGAGITTTPIAGLRIGLHAGYAFGAEHPLASLSAETRGVRGSAYLNRPRDVGVGPVASGAVNTLTSLFAGEDYTDPFFADGVEVGTTRRLSPDWSLSLDARVERQSSAALEADFSLLGGDFRPVGRISEGDFYGGEARLERAAPQEAGRWWTAGIVAEGGLLQHEAPLDGGTEGSLFLRPRLVAGWGREWGPRQARLEVNGQAGFAVGELPPQALYLIGGRGTVPGYAFRAFGGDRFAALGGVGSFEVARPWVRGRVLGALGWSDAGEVGGPALGAWGARTTGGVKPSLGVGVGIFHDIVRLDLARGLGDGGVWELIFETRPSFWDFL